MTRAIMPLRPPFLLALVLARELPRTVILCSPLNRQLYANCPPKQERLRSFFWHRQGFPLKHHLHSPEHTRIRFPKVPLQLRTSRPRHSRFAKQERLWPLFWHRQSFPLRRCLHSPGHTGVRFRKDLLQPRMSRPRHSCYRSQRQHRPLMLLA
jgi:hypothetical protein